jgi:hypothetical protein
MINLLKHTSDDLNYQPGQLLDSLRTLSIIAMLCWIALLGSFFFSPCGVTNFNTPYRCASIVDFHFKANYASLWYFLLILGWIPSVAAFAYDAVKWIRRTRCWPLAGFLTSIVLCGIWIALILLTDGTHSCAFGFGGMSCFGFWENFSINVLILGWVPALIAMFWFFVDGFRWLSAWK